jgi:hypothetical protein
MLYDNKILQFQRWFHSASNSCVGGPRYFDGWLKEFLKVVVEYSTASSNGASDLLVNGLRHGGLMIWAHSIERVR